MVRNSPGTNGKDRQKNNKIENGLEKQLY